MHYYQSIIHAHRPWMSKTYIQPSPPQGPGSAHARQACIDAAISVAKLLEAYERRYSFRRIHTQGPAITCSAALLLIFADVCQYGCSQGLTITSHLSVCFRALEEFGQSWESAKRARDFLLRLQRQWELKARARRNVRRGSGLMKPLAHSSRKRPLTATDFETNQTGVKDTWPNNQAHKQSQQEFTQILQQPQRLQETQQQQGSNNNIGVDFDMDFDWILEASDQTVPGEWTIPTSISFPFDLMGMGFLGDSHKS